MELAHVVHFFGHVSEHLGAEHISLYANAMFAAQLTVWAGGTIAHAVRHHRRSKAIALRYKARMLSRDATRD
jgi:hypothetical protein